MELNTIINNVSLTKVCNIKPFEKAEESKQITLNIKFDGVTLRDVLEKAITNTVIQWQNTNRKNYESLVTNSTVNVSFKSPGRTTVDPKQALIAEARSKGIDVEDKKALTQFIMEQIASL